MAEKTSKIKARNKQVNWKIFDIDPWDDNQDVTRRQTVNEYKKFNGSSRDFTSVLAKDYGWSGAMCVMVEDWIRKDCNLQV